MQHVRLLSMLTHRRHDLYVNSGIWGVSAWEQFENVPSRLVPKTSALSGDATISDLKGMHNFSKASPALTSSDASASDVKSSLSDASAAAQALSAHSTHEHNQSCKELAPQQPQPTEQAVEQGDGSEFWS